MSKQKNVGINILLGIFLAAALITIVIFGIRTFMPPPEYPAADKCVPGDESGCQIAWAEHDLAMKEYNNKVFYAYVIPGLIIALVGMFMPALMFQIVGIVAGVGLLIAGIMNNFHNSVAVFVTATVIFILIAVFGYIKFGKKK